MAAGASPLTVHHNTAVRVSGCHSTEQFGFLRQAAGLAQRHGVRVWALGVRKRCAARVFCARLECQHGDEVPSVAPATFAVEAAANAKELPARTVPILGKRGTVDVYAIGWPTSVWEHEWWFE